MKFRLAGLCAIFVAVACFASDHGPRRRPPAIFFTDLLSGPNSGGADNNGTILTIYGNRFGHSREQSQVTVGGRPVAKYLLWSDSKISVEIGRRARTGNIVVQTRQLDSDGAQTSNGTPFTVRPGNIYCVSTRGLDSNSGAFPSSCWTTLVHAKDAMVPGDIAYAMDGVMQAALDGAKAALVIRTSGTPEMPIALVAYPHAHVSIGLPTWGDPNSPVRDGVRIGSGDFAPSHWVIAGMFIQAIQAINFTTVSDDWRFIGNEMTCPNGASEMPVPYTADVGFEGFGCATGGGGGLTNLAFYGNYVHDTGTNCAAGLRANGGNGDDACKLYHAVYFGPGNLLDLGWNVIAPNGGGCRAVQFHNTGGTNQFGLRVHDNVIHDSVCDGINFATVDPSQGTVEAYNNLIYNAGTGPDPGGQFSNYACIYSADITNSGTSGTGTIQIFNNTLYNCGARPDAGSAGAFVKDGANPALTLFLRNNIVYQTTASNGSPENYVAGDTGHMTGTNNLWFGVGPVPSGFLRDLNADPRFVDLPAFDFHLRRGGPGINAGVPVPGLRTDLDGTVRHRVDLGAYEAVPGPEHFNGRRP